MYTQPSPKQLLTPFWLIAASFVGIADTLYLAWNHLMGTLPTCSIVEGCDIVLQSKYANVLGMPLSYWGLIFYVYLLGLAILLAIDPHSRGLRLGALAYGTIGALCSCVFAYMWVFLIHALCLYCLASAITTVVIFGIVVWHWRITARA